MSTSPLPSQRLPLFPFEHVETLAEAHESQLESSPRISAGIPASRGHTSSDELASATAWRDEGHLVHTGQRIEPVEVRWDQQLPVSLGPNDWLHHD